MADQQTGFSSGLRSGSDSKGTWRNRTRPKSSWLRPTKASLARSRGWSCGDDWTPSELGTGRRLPAIRRHRNAGVLRRLRHYVSTRDALALPRCQHSRIHRRQYAAIRSRSSLGVPTIVRTLLAGAVLLGHVDD